MRIKMDTAIRKIVRVSSERAHYPFSPPSILELKTKSNLINSYDYGKQKKLLRS